MKILCLEDHRFYAGEVIEYLKEQKHEVDYADNWEDAEKFMKSGKEYEISIMDVILKNGKTGVLFAEKWNTKLGRILFITGCVDEITIKTVNKWSAISKMGVVWKQLNHFISGGECKI
jgi:DNA-binding response OmpR family regulator